MQIVDATLEDIHAIGQIQIAGWLDSYASSENGITTSDIQLKIDQWVKIGDSRIEGEFKKEGAHTWIAKVDNQIVGFIGVNRGKNIIEALFVLPAFQGQGIGSKLLDKALESLDNSRQISIEVVSYNERAKSLYKRYGFIEGGEATDDVITLPNGKIIPKILMFKNPLKRTYM